MTTEINAALIQVMVTAEIELPLDARSLQIQLRRQADNLCVALIALLRAGEEIPESRHEDLQRSWQYAEVMSSMWQAYAYAVGQPMALEYVQSAFEAASRRAQAFADVVAELSPRVPLAEPTLISDLLHGAIKADDPA